MLDDLYQADTEAAINDLITRPPQTPTPQASKFSAWKTLTAAPRGVGTGANETAGGIADVLGAFGQTMAATDARSGMFSTQTPEQRKQETQARRKMLDEGLEFSAGDDFRQQARQWMPDAATSHVAEQTVFGLTRFGTKAVAGAAVAGPVAGAGLVGLDEALTTADDLKRQGVDPLTRSQVGAVVGLTSALGVALPVAGNTATQTAALVAVGGPLSFMGQQAATREILQAADYTQLADQYDPLDPVGLAVSTIIPAGFGMWAMRGVRMRAAGKTADTPETAPDRSPAPEGDVARAQDSAQTEPLRPTPEQVDAARVEMLTQHVESARLTPPEDVVGARAHDEAMTRSMDQMARGERVEVSDVAPVPRVAPTDTPEFKAWFGASKVVDEQGRPLVVYHGTNADVPSFDFGRAGEFGASFGRMAFFSSDPTVAGSYAARWMGSPEFVAAKELQDAALSAYAKSVVEFGRASQEAKAAKAEADKAGAAAKAAAKAVEEMAAPSDGANLVPAHLSLRNPLEIDAQGKSWVEVNESALKAAQDGGHDGAIIKNVIDSANATARKPSTVYAVFSPSSIKSAIGNSGKFDPGSPSLTDSRFSTWADQINAAIADIRAAAKEAANVQDAPKAGTDAPAGAARQPEPAAQPQAADARSASPAGAGEQGGAGVSGSGGNAAEAGLVAQRLAEVQQQFPDLTVQMDGMDKPMPLADFLAQVQREAMEGSDFDLGGNDAPLMQVAATCFLLNG